MDITAASMVSLTVSRFIKSPPDRVFAAWTNPDELMKWIGPNSCRALSAKLDPRPGGEYRIRVHSDNLGEVEIFGAYREVQPPSRLVFTWNIQGEKMEEVPETTVTVDFVPVEDGTDIQLLHEELPNPAVRDEHSEGWNGSLMKLCKLLTPEQCAGPQPPVGAFCWNELLTSNLGAATTFYNRLFDWEIIDSPIGDMDYKMFQQRMTPLGGAMTNPTTDAPPQWLAYVRVDDVDNCASKASALGGKVVNQPMDIPNVGRIAIIQDPQGAVVGIYARKETEK